MYCQQHHVMERKYLIVAVVAVAVLAGCVAWFSFYDNSSSSLAGSVRKFSDRCPVEMVPGNVIESMTYDRDANNVTANVSVSSYKFASLDSARHATDVTLLFQDFENRRILEDMVKAGASLTLVYEVYDALNPELETPVADVSETVISHDDLSAMESGPLLDGKQRAIMALPACAIELNALCPVAWSDGAEIVGAEVDDDEDVFCLNMHAANVAAPDRQKKVFWWELKNKRNDFPQLMTMLSEVAAAGYGLRVRYLKDDGITVGSEIEIMPRDIRYIANKRR